MQVYEIDDDGYIINNYDINGDVEIPEGCITVQLPQPLLFHRPKWNESEWIEGATQEEIDAITKPKPQPPTETELLKQRLIATENALAELILGGM